MTGLTEELQLYADAALYRAKAAGRDRVELFTGNLTKRMHDNRTMVKELHRAIDRAEFEPVFQPQVCARTGKLAGVEALVRWRHPRRGLLPPEAFMPLAAQLRIVPEIDRAVITQGQATLAHWHAAGIVLPKIGFNICADHLREPDLPALLDRLDFGATQVALELREASCLEATHLQSHLATLRDAGIALEIDDFGSGRAAIMSLMELRPSAIKIDRRVTETLKGEPGAEDLVRAIVSMAKTLGVTTLAEGVETQHQAETLRAMGCEILQGFWVAPPLDAAGLASFIQNREIPLLEA